jgi:hypothetical protein
VSLVTDIVAITGAGAGLLTAAATWRKSGKEARSAREKLAQLRDEISTKADAPSFVIYDSHRGIGPFDFQEENYNGADGRVRILDDEGGQAKGILAIERTTREGTFVAWLSSYATPGGHGERMPRSSTAAVSRRFSARFDARTVGGSHELVVRLKAEDETPERIGRFVERISSDSWVRIEAFFQISPMRDFRLRFEDRRVTDVPSTLQIRDFVFAEHA